jgi:hypothetical protein
MCCLKQPYVGKFSPLQTVNVAYLQGKIQLSGFSAYPDGSPSQFIRTSRVLLYNVFGDSVLEMLIALLKLFE